MGLEMITVHELIPFLTLITSACFGPLGLFWWSYICWLKYIKAKGWHLSDTNNLECEFVVYVPVKTQIKKEKKQREMMLQQSSLYAKYL